MARPIDTTQTHEEPKGRDRGGVGQSDRETQAPGETRTAGSRSTTGISNRESAEEESQERLEHPPLETSSPPPEDAAGRVGEEPLTDTRDRHTSHKAGSRSIAQKEAESRYPDRSMPATHKVAGAFGRESDEPSKRDA